MRRLLVALLALGLLLNLAALAAGSAPLDVYAQLARTSFTTYGLAQIAFRATPLIVLGTALSLSGRAGLINIGAEGQLIVASLAMGALGPHLPAQTWALPLLVLCGAATGALYALIPALLRERAAAPEVMTTIMLNFVAAAFANYCIHFLAPAESTHTMPLPQALRFARLAASTGSQLSIAFVAALVIAAAAEWWMFRTRGGFALRAYGESPRAALLYGAPPALPLYAFLASGALCGLAAAHYVGSKGFHEDGFSGGAGFVGLAVALTAAERPLFVVPAALLFGFLAHAALAMNSLVPKEMADVLVAALMLFALRAAK
jgi:simple sugar transport system permease protein